MLNQKPHTKVLFLDIETVSTPYSEITPITKKLFVQKYEKEIDELAKLEYDKSGTANFEKAYATIYERNAHLTPEFGKIACISVGVIGEDYKFKMKSFVGDNEKDILTQFTVGVRTLHDPKMANADMFICGHNIKNFDIPFISRRILYNGMVLPVMLDTGGLKPWEMSMYIDTKESLKFGGWDAPSLEQLCFAFGIQTSCIIAEPTEVKNWYAAKEFSKISDYCEMDLLALAKAYLKLRNINNNLTI